MKEPITSEGDFTPQEVALRAERGRLYRTYMQKVISLFRRHVDDTPPAIMLSGGIDSRSLLEDTLALGVRPAIFTLAVAGHEETSADYLRAKRLAEFYRLDFHPIYLPEDPDVVVQIMCDLARDYPELSTTADIQVLSMFDIFFDEIKARGYTSVYSGIADLGIHFSGRKIEIEGRGKGIPTEGLNYRRTINISAAQYRALTLLGARKGVSVLMGVSEVSALNPYVDVPWHVINIPRAKNITRLAYEQEIKASKVSVIVQPMQAGSSGANDYYDRCANTSPLSHEIHEQYDQVITERKAQGLGETRSSGIPTTKTRRTLANRIYPIVRGFDDLDEDPGFSVEEIEAFKVMNIFDYRVGGSPLTETANSFFRFDEQGRAYNEREQYAQWQDVATHYETWDYSDPSIGQEADDDLDVFGLGGLDEEPDLVEVSEYYANLTDEGEPDRRTNCWGEPLFLPEDKIKEGSHQCERALSGACTSSAPSRDYNFAACAVNRIAVHNGLDYNHDDVIQVLIDEGLHEGLIRFQHEIKAWQIKRFDELAARGESGVLDVDLERAQQGYIAGYERYRENLGYVSFR